MNGVFTVSPPQAENFDVFETFLEGFPLIFPMKSQNPRIPCASFLEISKSQNTLCFFPGKSTFSKFHKPKHF
jgi:hypothetical protein